MSPTDCRVVAMARFVANDRAFVELVTPKGIVGRAVAKAAGRTRDRAKQNVRAAGRIDKGALWQGINSQQIRQTATSVTHRVSTNVGKYAEYQEEGTGPGRIYPKRAKYLRFKPKGSKVFIFAKSVAPVKGAHFMRKALQQLKVSDF